MPDVLMQLGWALHMCVLAGFSLLIARKMRFAWRDWPFVVFIVVWADMVLASHLVSIFGLLNRLDAYVFASAISFVVIFALLRRCHTFGSPLMEEPRLDFVLFEDAAFRKRLYKFLGITIGLVTICNIIVITSSYPDNADSIIYRLPRAFWYVSNGSFLHPFDAIDKRLIFYPLDGVALYVPIVLYELPGVYHNFPSLFMWFAVAYTSYRFARSLGAERLIASFAAWLIAMTPNIMAQAVSTNDEILAAAALLVGLFMGWRWITTGARSYFFLMATSVGLSIGTKLHIVFLSPIILVAFFIAIKSVLRDKELIKRWIRAMGGTEGALSLVFALVMIVPFLFYNYASTGRFYFLNDFAHDVFNLHSSIKGAFQNLLIYTAQMVLAPVADLNIWPVATDRQAFNTFLNELTNPLIMPFIDTDPSFYHAIYRFTGITIPVSVRFVEFSLWAGFVWMLWPFAIAFSAKCRAFALKPLFVLFAMTPLLWLLLWSASTLYMEGTATYFSFYLTVAAPAAAAVFLQTRDKLWNELRWVAIIIVTITNLVIVCNIHAYSGFRSIPDIVRTERWPFDWLLFDRTIVNEIRLAKKLRVVYTHEKMPYFSYMRWNPMAVHMDPYHAPVSNEEGMLQIIPACSFNSAGFFPIKIPGKLTPGATFLGLIRGIGREAIFGVGNDVEKRHPDESDYIIPQLVVKLVQGQFEVSLAENGVVGYNKDDHLEYSYEILAGKQVFFRRDWSADISFTTVLPYSPGEYQHFITIKVRSAWSHKELSSKTYQLLGPGAWLPDGPEY